MSKEIPEAILRQLRARGNLELFKEILKHIGGQPRGEGRSFMNIQSLTPGLVLADTRLKFLVDNGFLTFTSLPPSETSNIYRGSRYGDLPDTLLWDLHDAREIVRKMLLEKLTRETQLDNNTVYSVTDSIVRAIQKRGLLAAIGYGGHIAT